MSVFKFYSRTFYNVPNCGHGGNYIIFILLHTEIKESKEGLCKEFNSFSRSTRKEST